MICKINGNPKLIYDREGVDDRMRIAPSWGLLINTVQNGVNMDL